ncbi:MAG: helix-turn-helix domain-containing protein [Bacteroidota bacterium]
MEKPLEAEFENVGYVEKEFGLQLVKLEDVFSFEPSERDNPFEPSRINFFLIIFLTKGQMTHEVNFKKYEMFQDDCIFVSKGQIVKFDRSGGYKGYGIIFTEEYILHHLSPSALSRISLFYNYNQSTFLFKAHGVRDPFIDALRDLSKDLGTIKADIMASILTALLLKAQAQIGQISNTSNGDHLKFIQFQKLVESDCMESRKAREYARSLNLTYKQLNTLCKTFTKKTAKEYIDNYVVLQAKRLLVMSKLPIKHTAYECGFSEETNFLKFFKKIAGITPAQFREMRA